MHSSRSLLLLALCLCGSAFAQYNSTAGVSAAPAAEQTVERQLDKSTNTYREVVRSRPLPRDSYGNASSTKYDLAVDGAFEGQTIVVLQLYTLESNFDFVQPREALRQKGFSVVRYTNGAPAPKKLAADLEKACQLWIIGSDQRFLTPEHLAVIKRFFDAGHGLYLWGDNEPYYSDTNYVAQALLGSQMAGNLIGDKTVPLMKEGKHVGVRKNHLLTTGLEYLYEGITIATLTPNESLTPLVYGSAGNLVTAVYEKDGKRAILDGGFTRLYCNWDTAGTGRYVKNAAAWLVNAERFPNAVARAASK